MSDCANKNYIFIQLSCRNKKVVFNSRKLLLATASLLQLALFLAQSLSPSQYWCARSLSLSLTLGRYFFRFPTFFFPPTAATHTLPMRSRESARAKSFKSRAPAFLCSRVKK